MRTAYGERPGLTLTCANCGRTVTDDECSADYREPVCCECVPEWRQCHGEAEIALRDAWDTFGRER